MNIFFALYLLGIAPKLFWDRFMRGKKHPLFRQRLGLTPPVCPPPLIWIHAVSLGEVKSIESLLKELKAAYPNHFFLITTTSKTGNDEAKKRYPNAYIAYLPLDFSWSVKRWVSALNPTCFILIEGDFWPNLLRALKKKKVKLFLVSGKISKKSLKRFLLFPQFSKKLFSLFDHLFVQSEEYKGRFSQLVDKPEKIEICGNLKWDQIKEEPPYLLSFSKPCITIACTHPKEEAMLIDALYSEKWQIILAPRHPERFAIVKQLLEKKNISFGLWSKGEKTQGVILLDAMGKLPICYASSRLAILGGSFVPKIGGHNLLEPIFYRCPVFFGPFAFAQKALREKILSSGAGSEVVLENLKDAVEEFFLDGENEEKMRRATDALLKENLGAAKISAQKIIKAL